MTTSKNSPLSNDLRQALHALDLLSKQISSGRIEKDYALRQVDKLRTTLNQVTNQAQDEKSAGRFEALYKVSRILGTSLDLQTVLDQVMDAVIQLTGAERGFLMLHDDDGNLTIKAARNFDKQTVSDTEFDYSRTVANLVIDNGEAVLTTNALEDPRFKEKQSVMKQSLRSIMAAPLLARGSVIGIAYVENRVIAGLFTEDDLDTLRALAGQASVAIDNALLFEETDEELARRIDELRMLRRIDMQLNQKLDPEEAMGYTLETAARVSRSTEGSLGIIQGDPRQVMATHHYSSKKNEAKSTKEHPIRLQNAYPQVWDAIDTGETIIYDTGQFGLITAMIVPILLDKEAIGVVVLLKESGEPFTREEQELIERIVTRAAINIDNGRLFKAVETANDAKTEFVGIVAHDLKTPMTSIQGYADLLMMQSDTLTEQQYKFLARISNTVKRMEILVSDLADVSRIEGGQFLMDKTCFTTSKIIEDVRDTIIPQIQERHHTYKEDIGSNLPEIYTDYYRLIQVLINLLSNAYKYTPNGGTITLSVQEVDNRVCFAISDTGIGLNDEQIKKLGTPFWRADDDYTNNQSGTGLGFFITRSLVRQMDSYIKISSEVGAGSTFSFSLAIATEEDKRLSEKRKED